MHHNSQCLYCRLQPVVKICALSALAGGQVGTKYVRPADYGCQKSINEQLYSFCLAVRFSFNKQISQQIDMIEVPAVIEN